MEALTTTFLIPDWISAGLTGGLYERVGGVIREVGSKHVVSWLKEGFNPVGGSFLPTGGLPSIDPVTGMLNFVAKLVDTAVCLVSIT